MNKKSAQVKRINEIESGTGPDATLTEIFTMAKALDVHPFTLLWPEDVKASDMIIMDHFFKSLTVESIKKAACAE